MANGSDGGVAYLEELNPCSYESVGAGMAEALLTLSGIVRRLETVRGG